MVSRSFEPNLRDLVKFIRRSVTDIRKIYNLTFHLENNWVSQPSAMFSQLLNHVNHWCQWCGMYIHFGTESIILVVVVTGDASATNANRYLIGNNR